MAQFIPAPWSPEITINHKRKPVNISAHIYSVRLDQTKLGSDVVHLDVLSGRYAKRFVNDLLKVSSRTITIKFPNGRAFSVTGKVEAGPESEGCGSVSRSITISGQRKKVRHAKSN